MVRIVMLFVPLILGVCFTALGYVSGEQSGRLLLSEVCSEAKSKNVKLESCGYCKWEATNAK